MAKVATVPRFRSSAFVEINEEAASRVERRWDRDNATRCDGGPPHERLGVDVWDLLRGEEDQNSWSSHLRTLDPGSLLVIIAGLP
eukprot:6004051-Pyramimonas_sp.AAC.1